MTGHLNFLYPTHLADFLCNSQRIAWMHNSQQYLVQLHLSNNEENILVFLSENVLNSVDFLLCFCLINMQTRIQLIKWWISS